MAKKPVLVVLAAGMGSRYGGLKQIDPVGSQGEAILDYSIYDAHQAGFDTVVIIIKEAIKKDFLETVGKRLEKAPVEIRYAYQELTDLPAGFTVPEGRVKPWGTAHAVFCAREAIDGAPFAVVNADDYYGKAAFKVIYDQLAATTDPHAYCMVGYELGKTVTDHGSVARGVCVTDGKKTLTATVVTYVKFRELSDKDIDDYVSTGEPFGKAGSYAIQETGDRFVESIDGDYPNIVGLSVDETEKMLAAFN